MIHHVPILFAAGEIKGHLRADAVVSDFELGDQIFSAFAGGECQDQCQNQSNGHSFFQGHKVHLHIQILPSTVMVSATDGITTDVF